VNDLRILRIEDDNILYAMPEVKGNSDFEVLLFVSRAQDFNDGFRYQRNGLTTLARLFAEDRDIGPLYGSIREPNGRIGIVHARAIRGSARRWPDADLNLEDRALMLYAGMRFPNADRIDHLEFSVEDSLVGLQDYPLDFFLEPF
jgi:hypothetical protein